MIDADRLTLALRRVADAELRAAVAVAGGIATASHAVAGRVSASISHDGDITVAVTDADGQPTSMDALIADLRAAMPGAFKTSVTAQPKIERYSLPEWQDRLAGADEAQRAELIRRAGAGEIEVSS